MEEWGDSLENEGRQAKSDGGMMMGEHKQSRGRKSATQRLPSLSLLNGTVRSLHQRVDPCVADIKKKALYSHYYSRRWLPVE